MAVLSKKYHLHFLPPCVPQGEGRGYKDQKLPFNPGRELVFMVGIMASSDRARRRREKFGAPPILVCSILVVEQEDLPPPLLRSTLQKLCPGFAISPLPHSVAGFRRIINSIGFLPTHASSSFLLQSLPISSGLQPPHPSGQQSRFCRRNFPSTVLSPPALSLSSSFTLNCHLVSLPFSLSLPIAPIVRILLSAPESNIVIAV